VIGVISKGSRVRVRTLVPFDDGTYSLAGVAAKVQAKEVDLTGRIAHVRGNRPTVEESTSIVVWIVPDDLSQCEQFNGLAIRALHCEKCDRIEVGPFGVNNVLPIE